MKSSQLKWLKCTHCGESDLTPNVDEREGDEILTGTVSCSCGSSWPVVRGVLRTVNSDVYVKSFSFQWQLHRKTQLDNEFNDQSRRAFCYKTGLVPEDFSGKRVLDVGVGTGRYADVLSRAGAHVVGVDLSYAVETAFENVGHRPNVNIMQSDLFDLPIQKESFDLIYSIGVLHHTPNCHDAFRSLLRYLRPGGTIAIWVYDAHKWSPGSVKESTNRIWRSVTSRLPAPLLYALCVCELPLYFLRKIPGFDQALHLLLPGLVYHAIPASNKKKTIREHILDEFDWFSPKYQSKHTYPEVFWWFEKAGLEHIRVHPHPVGLSGQKPNVQQDQHPTPSVVDEPAIAGN